MRSRSKKPWNVYPYPFPQLLKPSFSRVSPDCLVGIGYRRVVEVAAEDQRGAGRLYDGMYLAGLLGSFHEIALYGVLQLVDAVQVSDDVILLDALDERPALRDAGRLHVHVYDSDGSAVDRKVAPQAVVAAILERDCLPVRDRIFAECRPGAVYRRLCPVRSGTGKRRTENPDRASPGCR